MTNKIKIITNAREYIKLRNDLGLVDSAMDKLFGLIYNGRYVTSDDKGDVTYHFYLKDDITEQEFMLLCIKYGLRVDLTKKLI